MKNSNLHKCNKMELDSIVDEITSTEKLGEKPKHADYILICNDIVFIVEEANKPKLDDVEQVDKTVELLKKYRKYFPIESGNIRFKGIIHGFERIDPILREYALSKNYLCIECNKELKSKISRLFGISV